MLLTMLLSQPNNWFHRVERSIGSDTSYTFGVPDPEGFVALFDGKTLRGGRRSGLLENGKRHSCWRDNACYPA